MNEALARKYEDPAQYSIIVTLSRELKVSSLHFGDNTTGDPVARVSRRIGLIVISFGVNDDCRTILIEHAHCPTTERAVSKIWNGGERMVEASPWRQAVSLSNCSASEGCGFRA